MPTMRHPDLPDGQEVTVGESRARVMRRSGWEEAPPRPPAKRTGAGRKAAGEKAGTESTAGATDADGKDKPPPADRPQKTKE